MKLPPKPTAADAAPTAFEQLGYSKFDAKPIHKTFSLIKTHNGWAVIELSMRGQTCEGARVVCQPNIKAIALEQFRIHIGKMLAEGAQ